MTGPKGYSLDTNKTWEETLGDLERCFRTWGVTEYKVFGAKSKRSREGGIIRAPTTAVTIRFTHPSGREFTFTKSDLWKSEDNLRAIYFCIDDLRMVEKRGLTELMAQFFLQLTAASGVIPMQPARMPLQEAYEALGVKDDAPLEVAEAAFRALAFRNHPDRTGGGSPDAFKKVSEAIDVIRSHAKNDSDVLSSGILR